jgi:hypothetical protein
MTSRPAVVTVAALALIAAGCGSDNSGKIVGRWKADSGEVPIGPFGQADIVWEFTNDGAFSVSRVKPGSENLHGETVANGRYSLGLANNVLFTNLQPPLEGKTRLAEKIAVKGDIMTVGGGKDKTYRFTRLPPQ